MNTFRTTINLKPADFKINHDDKILCVGSCFAENMGERLRDAMIPVYINPFGISYNPISIAEAIKFSRDNTQFVKENLYFDGQLFHSWQHHGSFSSTDAALTLTKINTHINEAHLFSATHIIITFGTARVYELIEQKRIVNNCHKVPAKFFKKRLLSVKEIVEVYTPLFADLLNAGKKIILSVSPIRHLRDGFVENNVSKSILILAIHRLLEIFPEGVHYFPAYEIVLDDLRDYRFYADDMIHPSTPAIEYIWQNFQSVYFNDTTKNRMNEITKIKKMQAHRPLHPETKNHEDFKKKLEQKNINHF